MTIKQVLLLLGAALLVSPAMVRAEAQGFRPYVQVAKI
jgi:hypothetical protein